MRIFAIEATERLYYCNELQQPGPGPVITSYLQVITSNLQGLVDINLQSTAPSLLGSLCRVTVVPFRPAHQTGQTGWVSHQFGSTNVFPDAW